MKVDLLSYPDGRAPESSCHRGGTFLIGLSTDEPSMSLLNPPSSQKSPQLPLGRDAMTSRPLYDIHSQVPGLSHQVPGSGVQHQVQVQARLFASHFCTFARGLAAFVPLHFISRHPPPGAATRHPKRCLSDPPSLWASRPLVVLSGPQALVSSPHASLAHVSTCQLAS